MPKVLVKMFVICDGCNGHCREVGKLYKIHTGNALYRLCRNCKIELNITKRHSYDEDIITKIEERKKMFLFECV